jgi:hypothetical protein
VSNPVPLSVTVKRRLSSEQDTPDRDQAAADLIALAVDGGIPDNITCIVRCRRPSGKPPVKLPVKPRGPPVPAMSSCKGLHKRQLAFPEKIS